MNMVVILADRRAEKQVTRGFRLRECRRIMPGRTAGWEQQQGHCHC
jgi:hypothetical protein